MDRYQVQVPRAIGHALWCVVRDAYGSVAVVVGDPEMIDTQIASEIVGQHVAHLLELTWREQTACVKDSHQCRAVIGHGRSYFGVCLRNWRLDK